MAPPEYREFFLKSFPREETLFCRCGRITVEMYKQLFKDWPKEVSDIIEEKDREKALKDFRIMDNAVRVPQGFRVEIWGKLFKSTFKALKWKPSKKASKDDLATSLGIGHGVQKVCDYQARSLLTDEENDPFLFRKDPELFLEFSELTSKPFNPIFLNTSTAIQYKLGMEEETQFSTTFRKASRSVFKNETTFTRKSKFTQCYLLFLIFDKEIRRLPSVDAIYDFIAYGTDGEFDYDMDSFRTMCSRIKLSGNKWGSSMA